MQSASEAGGDDPAATGTKAGAPRERFGRFALVVLLVLFGGLLGLHLFVRTPLFCALSKNPVDVAPCYKVGVSDQSADVLLVGDSSLFYGIQPELIEAGTGIATYNHGLLGPSFSFDPAGVIDDYLAANAKPTTIVVYISPWNRIDPGRITDRVWFPLAVQTLRHGSPGDWLAFFAARPLATVEVPELVWRSTGFSRAMSGEWRQRVAASRGYLDYAAILSPEARTLPANCKPIERTETYAADNRASLTRLREQYRRDGIELLVYVAPTAACDRRLAEVRRAYVGVADNMPVALPDRYFTDDVGRAPHSHVNAEGSTLASNLLGRFLADRRVAR